MLLRLHALVEYSDSESQADVPESPPPAKKVRHEAPRSRAPHCHRSPRPSITSTPPAHASVSRTTRASTEDANVSSLMSKATGQLISTWNVRVPSRCFTATGTLILAQGTRPRTSWLSLQISFLSPGRPLIRTRETMTAPTLYTAFCTAT